MNTGAFTDLVRRIRNAYGLTMYRKKAGEEQGEICDFLYEQVGYKIPTEASDWIYDSILRESDKLPQKLHITLGVHLGKWHQAHTKAEDKEYKCVRPECKDGFLHVVKDSYAYVFRCMECNSRQSHSAIPGNTMHGLELAGYRLDCVDETMKRMKPYVDPEKWGKNPLVNRQSQEQIDETALRLAKKWQSDIKRPSA